MFLLFSPPAFGWRDWGAFPEFLCVCALIKSGLGWAGLQVPFLAQVGLLFPRWPPSCAGPLALPRRRCSALVRMRHQASQLPLLSGGGGGGLGRRRGPLFQSRRALQTPRVISKQSHPSFLLSCSSLNMQLEEECIIHR